MAVKPNKIQDLDINTIVTTDKHDRDLADLDKRITHLESKFGSNEQIADTLCVTAEKATKMQELFAASFVKLISTDEKSKDALTQLINKCDRNWLYSYLKRIGALSGSILLIILGAVAKTLVDRYLH